MKGHKPSILLLIVTLFLIILAGCNEPKEEGEKTTNLGGKDIKTQAMEITGLPEYPQAPERGTNKITADTTITLADDGITIDGNGASVDKSQVTIAAPGTYAISGSLSEGQIVVAENSETDKVKLILDGVSIHTTNSSPIYIKNAAKTVIQLNDGSVNILKDEAASGTDGESEPNAAIFSKDDLKIKGSGSLYLTANCQNGVNCEDDLKIEDAAIYITTIDNGLRGKDSVTIDSGTIIIEAQGNGICTNNMEDEGKGYIAINGGHLEITAQQDCIQAATDLSIMSGSIYTASGGGVGAANATEKQEDDLQQSDRQVDADPGACESTTDSVSSKGLKAGFTLNISGGTIVSDCADSAIYADDAITISGGSLEISTGYAGIHTNTALEISGGTIVVNQSHEGIEAANITISGGKVNLKASGDGIYSAGGNDVSGTAAQGEQDPLTDSSEALNINGGTIIVNAEGDGIAVNGNATIDGGQILVYGPSGSGNSGLDYGGDFIVNGGTMIVFSTTNKAMGISDASKQKSIFVGLTGKADSVLKVSDSNGKTLVLETSPKEFGCVMISTPDLTAGMSYNFYLDGENIGAFEAQ